MILKILRNYLHQEVFLRILAAAVSERHDLACIVHEAGGQILNAFFGFFEIDLRIVLIEPGASETVPQVVGVKQESAQAPVRLEQFGASLLA